MATNLNEILGRNIDSVKSLKSAIKELQDSLVGLDTESKEYQQTSQKLIAAQDALKDTTRAGVEANLAAKDSVVGMQKEYNELYNTYKKLTDEERNSDFGKSMAENLVNLSNKINDTKKDVGNFTNNIGRYAEGATEAFQQMGISIGGLQKPMQLAAGGAKTLGASLKALIANPVGAVIMAIVVALKALGAIANKVKEAIRNNEETQNRLTEAMATFKPVLDAVNNAFDWLAKVAVKVVEGLAKVGGAILSIIPGFSKAARSHRELAKATNELTKAQRENSVVASEKTAEIERLREEAAATQDVVEKKQLLEQAKAMQQEVDQRNIELAQEELRIMQEYAEKTANSAEENEKLAAAQKKVNDAIAQGERNMRQYNKQLSTIDNTINKAGSSTKNLKDDAKKLHEEILDALKTEQEKLDDWYRDNKAKLEKAGIETLSLTALYEKKRTAIIHNEIQKRAAERKTAEDNFYAGQARFYDNLVATEGAVNAQKEKTIEAILTLMDFEEEAYGVFDKIAKGPAGDVPRKIYEIFLKYGDFMQNENIDFAESLIKNFDFKGNTKLQNAVMDTFKKLGEEEWNSMWSGFRSQANELSKYGVNIVNLMDFEPMKKELLGQLSQLRIDEVAVNGAKKLIKELLSIDESLVTLEDFKNYQIEGERLIMEEQKKLYEKELSNFKGTWDQKLEMMQAYYDLVMQMREADYQNELLYAERLHEVHESAYDLSFAVENMINSIEQLMQAEIQSGKLTEEQAKKKQKTLETLQKVQLGVAIANIFANNAASIVDVWRGYASELVLNAQTAAAAGPGAAISKAALDAKSLTSAILRTSMLATQAGAQVAAAVGGYISKSTSATDAGASAGDVGVAATPTEINSTPYSYTRTIQTQEEEDAINNRPIFVTVTDLEEGLGQRARVVDESSF